jgi:hypothetical protein
LMLIRPGCQTLCARGVPRNPTMEMIAPILTDVINTFFIAARPAIIREPMTSVSLQSLVLSLVHTAPTAPQVKWPVLTYHRHGGAQQA